MDHNILTALFLYVQPSWRSGAYQVAFRLLIVQPWKKWTPPTRPSHLFKTGRA